MKSFTDYFKAHEKRFVAEWTEFLSFRSISADPTYRDECISCANWLSGHLQGIGFQTEVWPSDSLPLVYGVLPGNPQKPSVIFYGHYDVQPVDPLNLWTSPPFEPTIRDGRMYARGAQDNKGQVFYWMKAIEALGAAGADLPTIKVLIEGEEESGSDAIHAGLPAWKEQVTADILMVCDTGVLHPGQPTITMGLRGTAHFEIRVHGPSYDLHSGVYGGVVLNPLQALASILAKLHAPDGSIAVPGFYDHVKEPSAADLQLAMAAPINVEEMSAMVGVPLAGGERGRAPLERRGFRPTLEINGIGGGYQGAGGKTVIPSYGFAKMSLRLVDGQDPAKTLKLVTDYVESLAVDGIRVEIHDFSVSGPALLLSSQAPVIQTARRALREAFEMEPVYIWEGASIPIVAEFAKVSGAQPLLVGFGEEGDKIHAPDESFSLRQLEEGFRYVTSFFTVL